MSLENSVQLGREELDYVFSLAYEELRRLAVSVRRNDPGVTLSATTMVNEAWLKLSRTPSVARTSPLHFRRIAARAMRQVLVDSARKRRAMKRECSMVALEDAAAAAVTDDELLVIDGALDELARLSPRQAQVVESRFFGGLEMAEIGEALQVSESTVLREWRAARAWLAVRLKGG